MGPITAGIQAICILYLVIVTRRKYEISRLSAPDGAAYEYRWELPQPFAKEQTARALCSVESPVKFPSDKHHHEPPPEINYEPYFSLDSHYVYHV